MSHGPTGHLMLMKEQLHTAYRLLSCPHGHGSVLQSNYLPRLCGCETWFRVIRKVGIELLKTAVMKSSVFWDTTLCSPLKVNREFRR
jgi:hypothetical protein